MFFDGMGFVRCVAGDILRHERQLKKATDKSEIFGLTLLYSAILLPGRMKLNTANVSNLQPLTFSTWFCRLSEAFHYICGIPDAVRTSLQTSLPDATHLSLYLRIIIG